MKNIDVRVSVVLGLLKKPWFDDSLCAFNSSWKTEMKPQFSWRMFLLFFWIINGPTLCRGSQQTKNKKLQDDVCTL